MRHLCDLHTHSAASDGTLPPAELVALAERRGLAALALTDHDTLDGLGEAAAAAERFGELTFIGGVELSAARQKGHLHILGFYVDPANESILQIADRLRRARQNRNPEMISRLQSMGMAITAEEVAAAAGALPEHRRIIGRPHMAAVLVAKGYASDMNDAFDRYLGTGCPAYVGRDRPTAAEAIAAIHDARGVAVVAHPSHLEFANHAQCDRIVRSLIDKGIDGLEAYHGDHTDAQTRLFLDLAGKYDLIVTGGSDFHSPLRPGVTLGRPRVPATVLGPLAARAAEKRPAK